MDNRSGFRGDVLATDDFEEAEQTEPVNALRQDGAEATGMMAIHDVMNVARMWQAKTFRPSVLG